MQEMLVAALAGEGFEVRSTSNPAEVFRLIKQHQPDVAMVDLALDLDGPSEPVDGFGVLRRNGGAVPRPATAGLFGKHVQGLSRSRV